VHATCSPPDSPVATPALAGIAQLGFLLLFPGFFLYQTLIGMGVLGPFLGGYFAVVSIALAVPLGYGYFQAVRQARYRVAPTDIQFLFFLLYFLVVVLINAGFGADPVTVETHLLSILYFLNIYLVFKHVDFTQAKTMASALLSLLAMTALIFYLSEGGSFEPGRGAGATGAASLASYQGFARSYTLTFIPVICFTRSATLRLVLYCLALAALFLNGARSELVAVLLLLPVVELYRARSRLFGLCVIVLLTTASAVLLQDLAPYLPDSRIWELFDLARSESAHARHDLTEQALRTIVQYPVLGDYASYQPGGYSHNLLSAWVDLGAFGFAYLLLMLVVSSARLFVDGWRGRARSSHFMLAWLLLWSSLFLLLTAKTFDDMFAGAAMGAYANYQRQSWLARRHGRTA